MHCPLKTLGGSMVYLRWFTITMLVLGLGGYDILAKKCSVVVECVDTENWSNGYGTGCEVGGGVEGCWSVLEWRAGFK